MKKLTSQELQNITFKSRRWKNSPIFDELAKLKVGEAFIFSKDEWHASTYPSVAIPIVTYASRNKHWKNTERGKQFIGKKLSVKSTADGKSWVVIRKK